MLYQSLGEVMGKVIIYTVSVLIFICIGFFIGKEAADVEVDTIIDTVIVFVNSPPDTILKTARIEKVIKDTIIIVKTDTIRLEAGSEIAKTDTSFKEGDLSVKYIFPPVNRFIFVWNPVPLEVKQIVKTEYISLKPKWYRNPYLYGVAGLVTGIIIGR